MAVVENGVATFKLIPNDAALSDISISWDDNSLIANNTLPSMQSFTDTNSVTLDDTPPEPSSAPLRSLMSSDMESSSSNGDDSDEAAAEQTPANIQTYEFFVVETSVNSLRGFPNGELVTLTPDENGHYTINLEPQY